jgi:hypothetical protein
MEQNDGANFCLSSAVKIESHQRAYTLSFTENVLRLHIKIIIRIEDVKSILAVIILAFEYTIYGVIRRLYPIVFFVIGVPGSCPLSMQEIGTRSRPPD